jgi:hypothetical protein
VGSRLVTGAVLPAAALLASLLGFGAAPLPAAFCTYTFPPEGGTYRRTVVEGDVLCGRGGPDRVRRMEGGAFIGHGGNDHVKRMFGGRLTGGAGRDSVDTRMAGGTFLGNKGKDTIRDENGMAGGTFRGGAAQDTVPPAGSAAPSRGSRPGHGARLAGRSVRRPRGRRPRRGIGGRDVRWW